jgi:Ulp1 family protease
MRSRDVIVKKILISIRPADLQTLQGSSWLNDEIINIYGELLMERAELNQENYPKIHVCNTFFYEKLKTGYDGVSRWTKNV